jgi:Glycosyl transferase family 2
LPASERLPDRKWSVTLRATMFGNAFLGLKEWTRARIAPESPRLPRLGVLAIMKNEALNIDEWVQHYLWMGASQICLVDNGSTDGTLGKARAWAARGKVQVVQLPQPHRQRQHYRQAFQQFRMGRRSDWLLVADLDEFWFCPNGDTLAKALVEYDGIDLIYSNWVVFGSNGLIEQPPSVREGFTLRRPGLSNQAKYICRTKALTAPGDLHIHRVKSPAPMRTITETQRFQLNHYPIQSLEFFRSVKMTRGDAVSAANDGMRDMDYFRANDEGCTETDRRLADLVAANRTS